LSRRQRRLFFVSFQDIRATCLQRWAGDGWKAAPPPGSNYGTSFASQRLDNPPVCKQSFETFALGWRKDQVA
jgi:hypothetical protein